MKTVRFSGLTCLALLAASCGDGQAGVRWRAGLHLRADHGRLPDLPAWLRRDRHLEIDGDTANIREELCSAEQCVSGYVTTECGEQDPAETDWPCGARFAGGLPWATYGYAEGYLVLYVESTAAAGSVLSHIYARGRAIGPGYHAVARDDDALDTQYECVDRAEARALAELNQANGTQLTPAQASSGDIRAGEKYLMMACSSRCSSGRRVPAHVDRPERSRARRAQPARHAGGAVRVLLGPRRRGGPAPWRLALLHRGALAAGARRARLMLAAGLGLLLGSTVHIAVAAPRRVCKQPPDDEPYSRNVSLYAAGAMASVGLGLTIAGSGGLASSYRDGAPRPSSKQRWLAAGAGFVGAAISTVIPAIAFMLEGLACAD